MITQLVTTISQEEYKLLLEQILPDGNFCSHLKCHVSCYGCPFDLCTKRRNEDILDTYLKSKGIVVDECK